jgi:hypothetical protein
MLAMGDNREGISVINFMKYVVQVLRCDLSEQTLELFIKSDEGLKNDLQFISKRDLTRIFQDPFTLARIRLHEDTHAERVKLS